MEKNSILIKTVGLILAWVILPLFANLGLSNSMYYYEPFTNMTTLVTNGWKTNFAMGRDLIAYDAFWGRYDDTTRVELLSEKLFIRGIPNRGYTPWNNWFIGKGALFNPLSNNQLSNKIKPATPEDPFGYMIVRYTTSVDPDCGQYALDAQNYNYVRSYLNVWLAQDNGASAAGDRWENFVFFFDRGVDRTNVNSFGQTGYNEWGVFSGLEYKKNIAANFYDIDGRNLGSLAANFQRLYDDNNSNNNNSLYGNGYSAPVTQPLGIKMVHNGSQVSVYVNPDPENATANNTWSEMGRFPASWTSNLLAYFSAETAFYNTEHVESQFDHFIVRTVASNVVASITPNRVLTNSDVAFDVVVTPQGVDAQDSGIGEVYIKKPSGYQPWNLNSVRVSNINGTSLTRITTGTPAKNQFLVTNITDGGSEFLVVRFCLVSSSSNGIISSGDIKISFTNKTTSSLNALGDDFEVYVDCVKHYDTAVDWVFNQTTGIKYATTGKKKARVRDNSSLNVRAYSQPVGEVKIEYSPAPLIVGNAVASFSVKLYTTSPNSPDITSFRILIPTNTASGPSVNFRVSNNALNITNITSQALGVNSYDNINISTIGGSNFIVVYYTNLPSGQKSLPGYGGLVDTIRFNVYGTPIVPVGTNFTNYVWASFVNSDVGEDAVSGTTWQFATNTIYNISNQFTRVASSNAQVLAKISPDKVAIFNAYASNTVQYKYTIYNDGEMGNDVYSVKIDISAFFSNNSYTNLTVSNGGGGTPVVSNNSIWYTFVTPLASGQSAVISFYATHTNTNVYSAPTNTSFICWADNGNSSGYTLQREDLLGTWSVDITPPKPAAKNVLSKLDMKEVTNTNYTATLYTSEITNVYLNTIYNTSPRGVPLNFVKIEIPTNRFPSIVSVTSTHLQNQSYLSVSNGNNGTNYIYVKYHSDAGGNLLSVYDSIIEKDDIYITMVDSIQSTTFATMPTNIAIPTYVYKTTDESEATNDYTIALSEAGNLAGDVCTNRIYVEYPYVSAKYYIEPAALDTTSITNTLTNMIINTGEVGNLISHVYIMIPTNISTVVEPLSVNGDASIYFDGGTTNRIRVVYNTPLDGGQTNRIIFRMVDKVDGQDLANVLLTNIMVNQRETKAVTNIVSGKLGHLSFQLPKPKGGGGVSPNVFFVNANEPVNSVITQRFVLRITNTGQGTDRFDAVRIEVPLPLRGLISYVTNTYGAPSITTPSNITVIYTNVGKNIPAGSNDTITIDAAVSNLTLLPTNGTWNLYAANGFVEFGTKYYFEITNITLGSLALYGTERPTAEQNGAPFTTQLTNTFELTVQNGTNGSLPIRKVKIEIPKPLYDVQLSGVLASGASKTNITENGTNYIMLEYASEILAGNSAVVEITAVKPILSEETNVNWKTWVYYTNNYENIAMNNLKGDTVQLIHLPVANFYSYVSPNTIGKDESSGIYTFIVSNKGDIGNNLYHLRIIPPKTNQIITNITNVSVYDITTVSLTNTVPNMAIYSNDGSLYINYYTNNTNIAANQVHLIQLRAYDNQESESTETNKWTVLGANSKRGDNFLECLPPENIGRSLALRFVVPEYNSDYYVTPSLLSTVDSATNIQLVIKNTGAAGNNISRVLVYLPYPITNIVSHSSLLGATLVAKGVTNGSNFIEVDYPTDRFAPISNDILTLSVMDGIDYGFTNCRVSVMARYNTSGVNYIYSHLGIGTNVIDFTMPSPEMAFTMDPQNIYVSQTNGIVRLAFRLINKGKGSNNAQKVVIVVNNCFQNGLQLESLITNALVTNVTFNGTDTYELFYTNFTPNVTNELYLMVSNTNAVLSNFVFAVSVDNGFTNTNATMTLSIVRAPSAELVTKTVTSTYYSNYVTLNILNNTSGNSKVRAIRITPPPIFTNIVVPSSLVGSSITNLGSNLIVVYNNGLDIGQQDTVGLWVLDSTNMLVTNGLVWKFEADNGTGFGDGRELNPNSLKQNMSIPSPVVSNLVNTGWFSINTGKLITNTFSVTLSNTGTDANYTVSNVIVLPAELLSALYETLTNTAPDSMISTNGSSIIIVYTNPTGLMPNARDTITFQFTNNVFSTKTVNLDVYSYNEGNSLGFVRSTVEFKAPSEPTETYVQNQQILYSIDHSDTITYKINNGMYDLGIRKIRFRFSNDVIVITNIYSTLHQQNIAFSVEGGTNVLIDYETLGVIPNRLDAGGGHETLLISVVYTNTDNWTNVMDASVLYEKAIEFEPTAAPSGENNFIPVLLADFGRVTGVISPAYSLPTVKLYQNGTVATNKYGEELVIGANGVTGIFTLNYIPAGVYVLSYVGNTYMESLQSNIVVVANRVTNLGEFKMKRDLFRPGADTEQVAVSLDDTNSRVLFPVGVIGELFSVDIWFTNFTADAPHMENKAKGGTIVTPLSPSSVKVYFIDVTDSEGRKVKEQEIKNDAVIQLHYEDAEITTQGWNENSLALYYWRNMTKEWVRIGGVVDKEKNLISVKVSYIHRYYAIFGDSATSLPNAEGFLSVKAEPKIFTPREGDREVANVKISFAFDDTITADTYEVKIYSLKGQLIQSYQRQATYKQGEVFWNGKDSEGYPVKSGVYIYRIMVGNKIYSGTIVVAR